MIQLNDEERRDLERELEVYKKSGTKIYSIIGKFIFEFEEVCYAIRCCISAGLNSDGLNNAKLGDVLISELTAEPLKRIFISFYKEFNPSDTKGHTIVNLLLKRFGEIVEIRNNIIHGNLNVTCANVGGQVTAFACGKKLKNTKSGLKNSLNENHLDGKKYEIGYYNESYFWNVVRELAQIRSYLHYIKIYLQKKINIGEDLNDKSINPWAQFEKEQNHYLDSLRKTIK